MLHLHTVYQVDDFIVAVKHFLPTLICPAFALLGWCIYAYNKKYDDFEDRPDIFYGNKRNRGVHVGFFIMVMSVIMSFVVICLFTSGYIQVIHQYHNHKYITVEGRVANRHMIPSKDSSLESFDIDTLHFEYGSGGLSYSTISKNGGVIHNGLYVRIAYIKTYDDKVIVRLDTQ